MKLLRMVPNFHYIQDMSTGTEEEKEKFHIDAWRSAWKIYKEIMVFAREKTVSARGVEGFCKGSESFL